MWCCPHLKRKLMIVGGRKKKKKKKKDHIEEDGSRMDLQEILRASLKPCQEVGKIQKVGKK